jgi:hypothetical protein
MAVTGPIGILYVPSKLFVPGDPAATAANIAAHEFTLRAGVVASIACQVTFVFLVLALGRLFEGVSPKHERLMGAIVFSGVPVAIVNEIWPLLALGLVRRPAGLAPGQAASLAFTAFELHASGIAIAGVFWGLWLYPFGVLAMRSGFVPKLLGVLLVIGCFSYLLDSSLALLLPAARATLTPLVMLPLAAGEVAMVLWLLVRGVQGAPS